MEKKFYVTSSDGTEKFDLVRHTADGKEIKVATLYGVVEFNQFIREIANDRVKIVIDCEKGCQGDGKHGNNEDKN